MSLTNIALCAIIAGPIKGFNILKPASLFNVKYRLLRYLHKRPNKTNTHHRIVSMKLQDVMNNAAKNAESVRKSGHFELDSYKTRSLLIKQFV